MNALESFDDGTENDIPLYATNNLLNACNHNEVNHQAHILTTVMGYFKDLSRVTRMFKSQADYNNVYPKFCDFFTKMGLSEPPEDLNDYKNTLSQD